MNGPAGTARLPAHEVHVWQLPLDVPSAALCRLEAALSDEERERAVRFAFAGDRRRFRASHGWLRCVLSRYLDRPARSVSIVQEPGTKPRLAGPRDVRFSLAHSADLALLAVASARDVGVDVEAVRPLDDLDALPTDCLSACEAEAWARVPGPLRLAAFYETWTRKEAFLKALGEGLARPLTSFDVTVSPDEPPRLLRVEGIADAPARFELHALRPAPGFVGTLAVDGHGTNVSLLRATDALLD